MPNCECCGRFMKCERGAAWRMIFTGHPPTPDREVYRQGLRREVRHSDPQDGIRREALAACSNRSQRMNEAMYHVPTWRASGFGVVSDTVTIWAKTPEGVDALAGWMCTESRMHFGVADRLRLLLTGKLRISIKHHMPVQPDFSKTVLIGRSLPGRTHMSLNGDRRRRPPLRGRLPLFVKLLPRIGITSSLTERPRVSSPTTQTRTHAR